MIIFIDIDETICTIPDKYKGILTQYNHAVPNLPNIIKANKLFNAGHRIVYWTARGVTTGINWREVTIEQFHKWNVQYHELRMGKPYYDLFIDDKALNTKDWKLLWEKKNC